MNDNRRLKSWGSLAALGAVSLVPVAMACGGSNNAPANTGAAATGSAAMAPPGYPGAAPGAYPPGYPQQTPPGYPAPAGYPQPQAGYPQQAPAGYPQQAPAGYPPAGQTAPGYPPAGAPPAAPTASAAPGPLAPTDPNSLQGILAGIQGALQGNLAPGGALSGDVTDLGLKASAARFAPGMQPEGDELKQTLSEGQHAVMMISMQAGKCYTVLGFSAPGAVKDLDLNLLAPPLYITLAGQDLTHNNSPAVGGSPSPMCPVTPFPLQYKLDVFAKSGSGPVAVQLYSKTKS